MNNTHAPCGGEVHTVERQVVTRPADRTWPANVTLKVPYCMTCGRVVDYTELKES